MHSILSQQLKNLRLRDSRTQDELAQALGVTAQAVSRWETGTCYPDMELLPSIANFFGVSIDELFGYHGERAQKINALVSQLREMHRQNNGQDVCIDECIRLAREGLIEFPGNAQLMLCLASALLNAGYVRRGEQHLIDEEGYDIYDVQRHRGYEEWREAGLLYEQLLTNVLDAEMRQQITEELLQLYVNLGESEKAAKLAAAAPSLLGSREFLRLKACDGRARAQAHGETLLETVSACSDLMVDALMANRTHIMPPDAVEIIRNAIKMYSLVCTDGNFGTYHGNLSCLYLYLSVHLWRTGDHDGTFEALDAALMHARRFEEVLQNSEVAYTAPLLSTVTLPVRRYLPDNIVSMLPDDWPWWGVPGYDDVEAEIKADPRWDAWVCKTKE